MFHGIGPFAVEPADIRAIKRLPAAESVSASVRPTRINPDIARWVMAEAPLGA